MNTLRKDEAHAAPSQQHAAMRLMRISLVAVWLGTAVVSAIDYQSQGAALLASGGVHSPAWQSLWIISGLAADAVIGLALWFRPGRSSYGAALGLMLVMTVVASFISPALWLNPLCPLLKNLPIAAMLVYLMTTSPTANPVYERPMQ